MRLLYRSDNLCVRALEGRDATRWFITFDHFSDDPSLDRPGFGEAYFGARGLSVVSVVGRGNHWYQYPDMAKALAAIKAALEPARVRITYGSSMGGYAAIRFASAVGATACLALSPQYSIDPRKAPFERRWTPQARAIDWRPELDGPIRCRISPVIIYDMHDDDARHAYLIARDIRITPIALPHAGHPASTYLSSSGLLDGLITALHDQSLDADIFRRIARERRKATPAWIAELARRQPPHRSKTAVGLARRALELCPDNDLLLHILAQCLTADHRPDEALVLHRRAYERPGAHAAYGIALSRALYTAGRAGEALEIATELHDRLPHSSLASEWLAELHGRMGSLDQAIARAAARLALAPADMRWQAHLAHCRDRLDHAAIHRARIRQAGSWLHRHWRLWRRHPLHRKAC